MTAGFKAHYFTELASLEAGNFWFKGRNKIILWALKKYTPHLRSFLEIGCGTGFVISAVAAAFPQAKISGSEFLEEGLLFARDRVPHAQFSQMDARKIPYEGEFNVVGLFDVLEHIEEDELVLAQIFKALEPGGTLLVSVPQHQWLWSVVDEDACHVRRYHSTDLVKKVETAGFRVVRSSSFVTLLLPLMYLSRLKKRKKANDDDADTMAELRVNSFLDKILEGILWVDLFFMRMGVSWPVGGSLLLVARKTPTI